jgi:hypothetical protein
MAWLAHGWHPSPWSLFVFVFLVFVEKRRNVSQEVPETEWTSQMTDFSVKANDVTVMTITMTRMQLEILNPSISSVGNVADGPSKQIQRCPSCGHYSLYLTNFSCNSKSLSDLILILAAQIL